MNPALARTPYFSLPAVDYLLVGGASLLAYALFSHSGATFLGLQLSQTVVLYLAWVGNAPHFAATNFRLYRSSATIRQYPFTALMVPLVVLAGMVSSLAYPARIAPYFIKLYLLWSPFHYSGQALGVTLLYARRAGFHVTQPLRWALGGFIYGTFITAAARVESGLTKLAYFGIQYPTLELSQRVVQVATLVMWGSGVIFLGLLAYSAWKQRKLPPPILLLPAVSHYVWFIPGPKAAEFFQLVPFFHGIQYLLIAWFMQLKEKGRDASWSKARVVGETCWWSALNIAGGIVLLALFPKAVAMISHKDVFLALPVAIAAVQLHHFFVDGVIWKIKNPMISASLIGRGDERVGRGASGAQAA